MKETPVFDRLRSLGLSYSEAQDAAIRMTCHRDLVHVAVDEWKGEMVGEHRLCSSNYSLRELIAELEDVPFL